MQDRIFSSSRSRSALAWSAEKWAAPDNGRGSSPPAGPSWPGRLWRADAQTWTESDLPILDAARLRLGD
ncbi:hypothetical protein AB0H48_22770, partial [Streptomyces globisporus]|uniref:hypothetical protein n=1 Tax=Streptomyces globisporus TaxID=1908 RepID=UPI003460421D